MGGSSSCSAGNTTDCGAVDKKESGDISGGAACVKHGENLRLLLGREFGLPAALAALSSCRAKTGLLDLVEDEQKVLKGKRRGGTIWRQISVL